MQVCRFELSDHQEKICEYAPCAIRYSFLTPKPPLEHAQQCSELQTHNDHHASVIPFYDLKNCDVAECEMFRAASPYSSDLWVDTITTILAVDVYLKMGMSLCKEMKPAFDSRNILSWICMMTVGTRRLTDLCLGATTQPTFAVS